MSAPSRYIPMSFFDSLADARKQLRENSLLALETQIELNEWFDTAGSIPALQNFMRSYGDKSPAVIRDNSGHEAQADKDTQGVLLHRSLKDVASTASTYYVSPDMCEMIKQAAEAMPSEGLSPVVIPSEKGFLLFAHPLAIDGPNPGNSPEEAKVTAIMWKQGFVRAADSDRFVPGIEYFLFSNPHDAAVTMNRVAIAELKQAIPGMEFPEPIVVQGDDDTFATELDVKRAFGPLPIYDFSGWVYGQPWNSVPYDDPTGIREGTTTGEVIDGTHHVHPIVDQARRYLLATWTMLSQTVTKLQSENPPRYLRRRASRFMPETGDVVIIRLRREVTEGLNRKIHPDDADIPWYSYRFLVRGHWRRQPFGPGKEERKLIWIAPFVKGPNDAPLVVKDKIYSLEG